MHSTLVSTDLLAGHLNDSRWLIADCRYNLKDEGWGGAQYASGHIPGAVYVSLAKNLSGPRTGSNGRHPLPSPETMAATFARLGMGDDTQVVAYDQDAGSFASRLWWMLRYLGHDAAAVLDGGFAKWMREGRPLRSGHERRTASAFTPRIRAGVRLTVDEVAARLGDPSVLLVDARSPERFEGRPDPLDVVPGHIPGASNRHYRDNIGADGTMRPARELQADFARVLQGHAPADVVMYCGSGVTACHNLLAMEHAGIHGARLFPGSWSEWEADPERPVERG